jgi:stage II sporulation protein AB (anti-sigma F factor)
MEVINSIKFVMPALSVNESSARAVVSSFMIQSDPTVEELADIRTAVSEAVTNAVVHAYRGTYGSIELTVKLLRGREIYIRVKDKGCGIADVEQAMEPLFTTAPEEERSGLGFSVMQSFMDKLAVKSVPGKGTTVTMRKRLAEHGN